MKMTSERQELINLILLGEIEAEKKGLCPAPLSRIQVEYIADYILENGVKDYG
jgi:hypothetical protein